ncbi:zinc finger, CCHC-type [Artemisia annua]|uniref:Zinc finger, CCHC-type n=1 Tax=Artemisia annua TaxID=35608 RepID=A0A2U1NRW2_ARTAN|nr:zinc finger, CCHC-type [Artemisia annua]
MAGDGSNKNKNEVTKDSGTSITFQYPVLNSMNYTICAVKIKALFNVHGIWEAVEPTTDAEVDQKKNNMAIAMLYQEIPEKYGFANCKPYFGRRNLGRIKGSTRGS